MSLAPSPSPRRPGRPSPEAQAAARAAVFAHVWTAYEAGHHPTHRAIGRACGLSWTTVGVIAAELRQANDWPPWEGPPTRKPTGPRKGTPRAPEYVPTPAEVERAKAEQITRRLEAGWEDRRYRVRMRVHRVAGLEGGRA